MIFFPHKVNETCITVCPSAAHRCFMYISVFLVSTACMNGSPARWFKNAIRPLWLHGSIPFLPSGALNIFSSLMTVSYFAVVTTTKECEVGRSSGAFNESHLCPGWLWKTQPCVDWDGGFIHICIYETSRCACKLFEYRSLDPPWYLRSFCDFVASRGCFEENTTNNSTFQSLFFTADLSQKGRRGVNESVSSQTAKKLVNWWF